MQTTLQAINAGGWNKPDCPQTSFRAKEPYTELDIAEWVATCALDFAAYTYALMEAKSSRWKPKPASGTSLSRSREQTAQLPLEDGFERQKQAFKSIPPDLLAPYRGKFVASRNGVIEDYDTDMVALSHRVRERFGNAPVYITRVGKAVKMPTPFAR
jgi:hypothetical protein